MLGWSRTRWVSAWRRCTVSMLCIVSDCSIASPIYAHDPSVVVIVLPTRHCPPPGTHIRIGGVVGTVVWRDEQ